MPLKIIRADITKLFCDAIVNPTNEDLIPTGGTDAAIHDAAGQQLLEYCQSLGGCPVGQAKISPAFNLQYKYIIHTVGPWWKGGQKGERELLRSCYTECMKLAIEHNCQSVAFPLISSGLYGYPKDRVLSEATEIISEFLLENEMDVYIVVYDKDSFAISQSLFYEIEEYIDNNYIDFSFHKRKTPTAIDRDIACDITAASPPAKRERPDREKSSMSVGGSERIDLDACFSCECIIPSKLFEDMDKSFADTLFYYIDMKGLSDVEAYKRSNVSKKTFSKIKCTQNYNPSKITAVSFAIGLRLDIEQTRHLLRTAGICLSRSNKFDVIIEYFIKSGNYDSIFDVNEVLYQFDQVLLGV